MMDGFFVAYEYGSGAAWAYVRAETRAEVVAELPEVDVYDAPPEWMTVDDMNEAHACAVELDGQATLDRILDASRKLALAVAS
jgi:hypothetical protein